eukprot:4076887-Pyramimonas_sp.AAC.1
MPCSEAGTCSPPSVTPLHSGVPTFAHAGGVYGVEWPPMAFASGGDWTDVNFDPRQAQRCTICGYGVERPANASLCAPFAADGVCGELGTDGVSL